MIARMSPGKSCPQQARVPLRGALHDRRPLRLTCPVVWTRRWHDILPIRATALPWDPASELALRLCGQRVRCKNARLAFPGVAVFASIESPPAFASPVIGLPTSPFRLSAWADPMLRLELGESECASSMLQHARCPSGPDKLGFCRRHLARRRDHRMSTACSLPKRYPRRLV